MIEGILVSAQTFAVQMCQYAAGASCSCVSLARAERESSNFRGQEPTRCGGRPSSTTVICFRDRGITTGPTIFRPEHCRVAFALTLRSCTLATVRGSHGECLYSRVLRLPRQYQRGVNAGLNIVTSSSRTSLLLALITNDITLSRENAMIDDLTATSHRASRSERGSLYRRYRGYSSFPSRAFT